MLIFASLYARYHEVPVITSLFNGLQVVVVAIVANATYSFGKSSLKKFRDIILAIAASVLLWIGVSPFIVIFGAAFAGIVFLNGKGIIPASTVERETDGHSVKQLSMLLLILLLGLLTLYIVDKRLFNLATLMMRIDLFAWVICSILMLMKL
jgi:chromate transporter